MPTTTQAFVASRIRRRMTLEDITKEATARGHDETIVIDTYDAIKLAKYDYSLAFDSYANAR